ncbi:E3 ubiquitin-protein ligase MYCBP2-like isoform X2 [Sycon ciliatum]
MWNELTTRQACRFCKSTEQRLLSTHRDVCTKRQCKERNASACSKRLPCGDWCGGIAGEEKCLPCLQSPCCGDSNQASATAAAPAATSTANTTVCSSSITGSSTDDNTCCNNNGANGAVIEVARAVHYTADDTCAICYTDTLGEAPAIQLSCGHIFHKHCCDTLLEKQWSGPRISFQFLKCPSCEDCFMEHPSLDTRTIPMVGLFKRVKEKALLRLEVDKELENEAITNPCSEFYQKPAEYAMKRYAYYLCHDCERPYFGGDAQCAVQVVGAEFDPQELMCGHCSNVRGVEVCPKHGTDFIAYKCRYCCTLAVYFCWGTTHFCPICHDVNGGELRYQTKFPSCPVGPTCKKLEGVPCPLGIKHPPTGEEFAIGCVVCLDLPRC